MSFDISFLYACLPPLKNDGTRCYCEEVDRAGCQERCRNHRIEIVDKRNRKENKIVFGKQGVGSICLVFVSFKVYMKSAIYF